MRLQSLREAPKTLLVHQYAYDRVCVPEIVSDTDIPPVSLCIIPIIFYEHYINGLFNHLRATPNINNETNAASFWTCVSMVTLLLTTEADISYLTYPPFALHVSQFLSRDSLTLHYLPFASNTFLLKHSPGVLPAKKYLSRWTAKTTQP